MMDKLTWANIGAWEYEARQLDTDRTFFRYKIEIESEYNLQLARQAQAPKLKANLATWQARPKARK